MVAIALHKLRLGIAIALQVTTFNIMLAPLHQDFGRLRQNCIIFVVLDGLVQIEVVGTVLGRRRRSIGARSRDMRPLYQILVELLWAV